MHPQHVSKSGITIRQGILISHTYEVQYSTFKKNRVTFKLFKNELEVIYPLQKIYFFNPINHPTVMFKRNIILDFKYKKFFRMEDYFLWIRLILNKYRVKNIA